MFLADIPPRYPFQTLPPHYGRPYPFLLQPTAAADADGLAPDVPLPANGPEHLDLSPEDKPICLSPSKIPEPLREAPEEEPLADREVKAEVEDVEEGPAELPPLESPLALPVPEAMVAASPAGSCGGGLHEAQVLGTTGKGCPEPSEDSDFAEGAEVQAELPGRTESHTAVLELAGRLSPEPLVETKEEPVEVPLDVPMETPVAEAGPEEGLAQPILSEPQPSLELPDCDLPAREGPCPNLEAQGAVPVPASTCCLEEGSSDQFLPGLEDPLAGMNALAAAAEMPQARPLPSPDSGAQATERLDTTPSLVLEQGFLQGITLLSEIAELELERRSQEVGGECCT